MKSFYILVILSLITFNSVLGKAGLLNIGRKALGIGRKASQTARGTANKAGQATRGTANTASQAKRAKVPLPSRTSGNKGAVPTGIQNPQKGAPSAKPKSMGQAGRRTKIKKPSKPDKKIDFDSGDSEDEDGGDYEDIDEEEPEAKDKPTNLFEAVIAGAKKEGSEITEENINIDKEKLLDKANINNTSKSSDDSYSPSPEKPTSAKGSDATPKKASN